MKTGISDWKLERYLLGELDDDETRRIREAAAIDAPLRARLEALEESNHAIREKYPAAWMAERIRDRLEQADAEPAASSRRRRILRAVLVPAAAMVVVAFAVFVLPDLLRTGRPTHTEITRIKGPESSLRLFRKTDGGSEQIEDGGVATAGDLVLLQYGTGDHTYGAIVSVDGRGKITRHLPARGGEAARFESGRSHLLDYAYELDDAPHFEIFFFVTSASAFRLDTVIEALGTSAITQRPDEVTRVDEAFLRSLDLPGEMRVTTFTLIKGERGHEN